METYAVVRAHGVKSRLLSKQDYEALVAGTRRIWEFPDYTHILEQDPLEKKLEKAYKVYIDRMTLLAKISKFPDLIFALLDWLEVENIKFHLRLITGYQRQVLYYPYGRLLGLEKLKSLSSESLIWEALSATPLKAPAPRTHAFMTGLIAEREAFLEILYFGYLVNTIINLKWQRNIAATVIDFVTSNFTVRYAYWIKLLPENIVGSIIERYAPGLKVHSELLKSLEGTPTEILQRGGRMLALRAVREARKHPLDPVYVCALNYLLLLEAQNIERILMSKELGVPEEIIFKNLILPYT